MARTGRTAASPSRLARSAPPLRGVGLDRLPPVQRRLARPDCVARSWRDVPPPPSLRGRAAFGELPADLYVVPGPWPRRSAPPSTCASRRRGRPSTMSPSRTRSGRARRTASLAAMSSPRPTLSQAHPLPMTAAPKFQRHDRGGHEQARAVRCRHRPFVQPLFRDHFELEFYVRRRAKNGVKLVSITREMGVRSSVLKWRKGWDSNPRYPCRHAGFQDRCLKPLGHPSSSRRSGTYRKPPANAMRTWEQPWDQSITFPRIPPIVSRAP